MRYARVLLTGILLHIAIAGCSGCNRSSNPIPPTYGGGPSGSEAIPGTDIQTCYTFQYDTYSASSAPAKRRPLFAIIWRARRGQGMCSLNQQNLLTGIHGHAISPALNRQAVYALQPDYSLKELNLTAAEVVQLFSLKEKGVLHGDALFEGKVVPELKDVEAP